MVHPAGEHSRREKQGKRSLSGLRLPVASQAGRAVPLSGAIRNNGCKVSRSQRTPDEKQPPPGSGLTPGCHVPTSWAKSLLCPSSVSSLRAVASTGRGRMGRSDTRRPLLGAGHESGPRDRRWTRLAAEPGACGTATRSRRVGPGAPEPGTTTQRAFVPPRWQPRPRRG